ncbi:MAG: Uma2 family endonuclease [Spirochaetota bacterium]
MPTRVSLSAHTDRDLLTAADFLEWLEPGRHADLVDGEVVMHSPVSTRHADLLNFLDRMLGAYVDEHDLGTLYREVVAVKLSGRDVFLPDLAFYGRDRRDAIKETYVEGAPDLVVEVLSPATARRDTGTKFAKYELAGVREYWILDPETLAHRFYRCRGDELVEYADGEDRIDSLVVKSFFVMRGWLDPDRLPRIGEALARVSGGG